MSYKAHPTKYKGALFRSRLEARWAAFFDLCGWRWGYEPEDQEGWVPDFALMGRERVARVEVKPIAYPSDLSRAIALLRASPELEKVRKQGRSGLWVAGAQPAAFKAANNLTTVLFETTVYETMFPDADTPERDVTFEGLAMVVVDREHLDLIDVKGKGPTFFLGVVPGVDGRRIWSATSARIDEKWQEAGAAVQWRGYGR